MNSLIQPLGLLLAALIIGADEANAQTWMPTGAPLTNWASIACSADGSKLAAAANYGGIFVSTNGGTNWIETSAPANGWNSIAASADGKVLVGAVPYAGVWVSTNAGSTWEHPSMAVAGYFLYAAISADGHQIVAPSSGFPQTDYISISTNSGMSFQTVYYSTFHYFRSAASSASGTTLFASGNYGLTVSANMGASWSSIPTPYAYRVACSAEGEKIVISGYTSCDSGITWTPMGFGGTYVGCSADGRVFVAANPSIFTSTNCGQTWTSNSAPALDYWGVASSADGRKLFAAAHDGGIYSAQIPLDPTLNAYPAENGLLLAWTIPSQPFVLQQNSDLSSTIWTDVGSTPVLNLTNLQNQVVVPVSSGSQFFRLKGL